MDREQNSPSYSLLSEYFVRCRNNGCSRDVVRDTIWALHLLDQLPPCARAVLWSAATRVALGSFHCHRATGFVFLYVYYHCVSTVRIVVCILTVGSPTPAVHRPRWLYRTRWVCRPLGLSNSSVSLRTFVSSLTSIGSMTSLSWMTSAVLLV